MSEDKGPAATAVEVMAKALGDSDKLNPNHSYADLARDILTALQEAGFVVVKRAPVKDIDYPKAQPD